MINYKRSHTSHYIDQIPAVIEWLEKKGYKAKLSRYSKYEKYIRKFYQTKHSDLIAMGKSFKELTIAFQECIDIVTVFEHFQNEQSEGFEDRLSKVVKGQDFFGDSADDASRNYLYELLVASKFRSKGFTIDFDQESDVVATRRGDKIFIECKKLQSAKGLEANFKKAGEQLNKVVNSNCYGLVYMDVYSCISDKVRSFEYNTVFELIKEMNENLEQYYRKNKHIFDRLNDRYKSVSLGICLTTDKCMFLSNTEPQYSRTSKIITPSDIADEKFEKLNDFFNNPSDYRCNHNNFT